MCAVAVTFAGYVATAG